MSFTTNIFYLLFLPLSIIGYLALYKLVNTKICNLYLVILSIIFYSASNTISIKSMLMYIFVVWLFGQIIYKTKKKYILYISITISIALLFYYKYTFFTISQINRFFGTSYKFDNIIIPLGISFIIFESISYYIDIYLKKAKPGSITDVALFITFFPKVVSGPIVLWRNFEKQISNRKIDINRIDIGIERIIIGASKKILIADVLGLTVDGIWLNLYTGIDTPTAWVGALCYMMQIYFDFSGYSDIAIGICNIFGFEINENFNYPYRSKSITEFWRRWHISLGSWFRNYIYFPLGGSRKGNKYLNLFIVFVITGIWHGAAYTFLVWGILQGLVVVVERKLDDSNIRFPLTLRFALTITITYFSWIIFRSPNISSFIDYLKVMFGITKYDVINFTYQWYLNKRTIFLLIISTILSFIKIDDLWRNSNRYLSKKMIFITIFALTIIYMVNSNYSPFLYFQF